MFCQNIKYKNNYYVSHFADLDLLSNGEGNTVKLIKDREKYFSNPIFKDRVVIHYDLLNKVNTLEELAKFLLSNDFIKT